MLAVGYLDIWRITKKKIDDCALMIPAGNEVSFYCVTVRKILLCSKWVSDGD